LFKSVGGQSARGAKVNDPRGLSRDENREWRTNKKVPQPLIKELFSKRMGEHSLREGC